MVISFPSTAHMRDIVNQMLAVTGRDVTLIVESGTTECSTCSLDPTTGKSTDSFCPECGGNYYLENLVEVVVSGHVYTKGSDILDWHSGGRILDGDFEVRIKHTDENMSRVERIKKVIIDGRSTELKEVEFRGIPEINRIYLVLKEEGKHNG